MLIFSKEAFKASTEPWTSPLIIRLRIFSLSWDASWNKSSNEEAFRLIIEAIKKAGYSPGKDVNLAIDVAASELY